MSKRLWLVTCVVRKKLVAPMGGGRPPGPPMPGSATVQGHQMRDQKGEGVGFWSSKSHLTANISKTVSRSVTCQLDLKLTSARRELSKNINHGATQVESIISKNVLHCYGKYFCSSIYDKLDIH